MLGPDVGRDRATDSAPRVVRNDWGPLSPPTLGGWTPSLTVSVVIPAYNCQESLALTLASLAHQTYPTDLLEVVIVDDGSAPHIELPKLRPQNSLVIRVPGGSFHWGPGHAVMYGVEGSSGDVILRLDADMVVFPRHVEAHLRWHHLVADAVSLGYKRFVSNGWVTPDEVAEACAGGTVDRLFAFLETESHDYIEKIIDDSDQLKAGNHLAFRAHVGATAALRRSLYEEAGGFRPELRLGEDTEFGFRLAQAGALFIPEPGAQSWHMGTSAMMRDSERLQRYNQPFLADLMPYPRWLRKGSGRTWSVPLVTAVVRADGPFEQVRACVDALLACDERDLRVLLVGPFDTLADERRSVLDDPKLDLRLLGATYRSEPRVTSIVDMPTSVFPSPYRLDVPSHLAVGHSTVRRLVVEADRWQVGLVRVLPERASAGIDVIKLWRTAAVSRAERIRRSDEPLSKVVAEVHGQRWVSGNEFESTDLGEPATIDVISAPVGTTRQPASRSTGQSPRNTHVVEVAGVRSWWRATRYVLRLGFAELGRRCRRSVRRNRLP